MEVATVQDAVSMPFGGERNLALRAALGLVEGDIAMVNHGGVVQVVTGHERAARVYEQLRAALTDGWTMVSYQYEQPDGQVFISALPPADDRFTHRFRKPWLERHVGDRAARLAGYHCWECSRR